MAEGILRRRLAEKGLAERVSVRSGGVWGLDGRRASQSGVEVLAERGMDISQHRASSVTEQELAEADLVLVMEETHRRSLFHMNPAMLSKVFLISEMAGEHHDIADPFRHPKEDYVRTADELTRLIDTGFEQILQRINLNGNDD